MDKEAKIGRISRAADQIKVSRMRVEATYENGVAEMHALAEINSDGFTAAVKDYPAGKTEPHRHDYDVCLHILAGNFQLGLPEEGIVRSFAPGDRLLVSAGTLHFEEHGPLRMVVGRRQSTEPLELNGPV